MSQTRSLPVKSVSSLKRQHVAEVVWTPSPPHSERDRARQALAFLTCRVSPDRPQDGAAPSSDLDDVIHDNWVIEEPIVYEEFPPGQRRESSPQKRQRRRRTITAWRRSGE